MLIISDRGSSSALAGGEPPQILSRGSKSTAIEGLKKTTKIINKRFMGYTRRADFLAYTLVMLPLGLLVPSCGLAAYFAWNEPGLALAMALAGLILSPLSIIMPVGAIRNRKLSKKLEALQKQAHIEIEALGDELKNWLREHYGLELTHPEKFVLSALEIYETYDADKIWELRADTGARLNVRINIREDGSLEIHRAEISTPGESSLLEPIR